MTYVLYGIKACDTMKKARTWLDEHKVAYDFHDYKAVGIDREHLRRWCAEHGWQTVLNAPAPPSASSTKRRRPISTKPRRSS